MEGGGRGGGGGGGCFLFLFLPHIRHLNKKEYIQLHVPPSMW